LIRRLYLKDLISFSSVDIEFDRGLVVLSGPSGAGKSLLMSSVLSSFGISSVEAKLCEIEMDRPEGFDPEGFEIDDDMVIKSIKKDRVGYYINSQKISKKILKSITAPYIHYLSVRDSGGFDSGYLLDMIDSSISAHTDSYPALLSKYRAKYAEYRAKQIELEKIEDDESRLAELKEFAIFEIEKIKSINPKEGEDEELLLLKKRLSRMDKINDSLALVEELFAHEGAVVELYELLEKDSSYFSDSMNQLRADCDDIQSLSTELEDTDVESLLDRLEKISELTNRYGSIPQAIEYMRQKEDELSGYESITEDKSALIADIEREYNLLIGIANKISKARIKESKIVSKKLDTYLSRLKLPSVVFEFEPIALGDSGVDRVALLMQNSSSSTLSGGEHNRLRLAMMVVTLEGSSDSDSIIVLDEIDANVSGDESIAIADMISKLSDSYQIFAISHQPHLAAKANQHILIDKRANKSSAKILDRDGQINEIARIIGGELPTKEAIGFAQRLLDS